MPIILAPFVFRTVCVYSVVFLDTLIPSQAPVLSVSRRLGADTGRGPVWGMCLARLSTFCISERSTVSERSLAVNSGIYLSKWDAVFSLLHPPHSAVHTCYPEIKPCSRATRLLGALEFTQHSESHGQRSSAGYGPWGCKSRTRLRD